MLREINLMARGRVRVFISTDDCLKDICDKSLTITADMCCSLCIMSG